MLNLALSEEIAPVEYGCEGRQHASHQKHSKPQVLPALCPG